MQLVEAPWPAKAALSLRRLTNSGGRLPVSIVRRLRELFPAAELYLMYGLTEAFRSTYLDPALLDEHPDSIGSAIPFAEVMTSRPDGTLCAPGEDGELVHAGPLVAKGYWNDPERTAAALQAGAAGLALRRHRGLVGRPGARRTSEGLLYFVGREDAMIKTSGNRVSPTEVEEAAVASGVVAEAVALGVPDDRLGEAIAAGRARGGAGRGAAQLSAARVTEFYAAGAYPLARRAAAQLPTASSTAKSSRAS